MEDAAWIGTPVLFQRCLVFIIATANKEFTLTAGKFVPVCNKNMMNVRISWYAHGKKGIYCIGECMSGRHQQLSILPNSNIFLPSKLRHITDTFLHQHKTYIKYYITNITLMFLKMGLLKISVYFLHFLHELQSS